MTEPQTAVNSRLCFEGYFLAIGATSLRYEQAGLHQCRVAGGGGVFAILFFAVTHGSKSNVY